MKNNSLIRFSIFLLLIIITYGIFNHYAATSIIKRRPLSRTQIFDLANIFDKEQLKKMEESSEIMHEEMEIELIILTLKKLPKLRIPRYGL